MNSRELAKSNINPAKERLKHAEEALHSGNYAYCVRQSQEAVELALKGCLRLVGIEPPKWHDVGIVLRKESKRFPEWFRKRLDSFASISRKLRNERELAMYGDEEAMIPPEEIYSEDDAKDALTSAKRVVNHAEKLLASVGER